MLCWPRVADTRHSELPETLNFRDPERARRNLETIAGGVPAAVSAAIPALLTDAPDADAALNLFERLVANASPELFRLFARQRVLIHYALLIFGYSEYLGETLIKSPDVFHALSREHALDRSHSREEFRESFARFRSRSFESDTATLLALFKRREYVRIVLRDVLGIARMAEVAAELSALADVLIEEALTGTQAAFLNRFGAPQRRDAEGRVVDVPMAVLSLGKLGGNELNYSSDIDLLFIYGDGEDAGDGKVSNREYFIRLAQTVTDVLSRSTAEGSVFRVDLRLRPQGGQGEPAVSVAHGLEYYENQAADWELQAMIKLRHSAGDLELARRFIRRVQPFVYRHGADVTHPSKTSLGGAPGKSGLAPAPEFNFAAIETALESRDRIRSHRRSTVRRGIDVKLDRGGIRDIEFLVQCLQRVYGGAEPWLRSGGTLFSLQKLHDKAHVSGRDFHELTTAYEFLRKIEHRLQIRQGQQTHRIPQSDTEIVVLARAVQPQAAGHDPRRFLGAVEQRMEAVAVIYQRIIHGARQEEPSVAGDLVLTEPPGGRELSERQMLQRIAQDAPELYEVVRGAASGSHERRNLIRFLSAAFTTSERYGAVVRSPRGVARAMRLFQLSDFATSVLLGHPDEVATLDEIEAGPAIASSKTLTETADLALAPDPVFSIVVSPDTPQAEKLALLRQQFRHRVFASAARDVIECRPVFCSLAETTAVAEDVITAAAAAISAPSGFAILAMGRLGTREFDLLSDADLVFVRNAALPNEEARRAAERLMQVLSAYTREGTVFAIDVRLRPHGEQGELVVTPAQLADYFKHQAAPWEALSFTKLRFIAGNRETGESALATVRTLAARFAGDTGFPGAVREMRRRLEQSGGAEWNLKTSPGGMYDLDFIAKFFALRASLGVQNANIRERIEGLVGRQVLDPAMGSELADAGELIRAAEHAVRLATGANRATLPVGDYARSSTAELAKCFLGRPLQGGLEEELRRSMARTREIFDRLVR
jgi:glutamate-ammonia-ligase adenylyltransferase